MKYTKIYVLAPYAITTGGVELSHQLVDYLRNKNQEAYIVYLNEKHGINIKQDITEAYNKYNIKTTKNIVDEKSNILICPEIYYDFMYIYKNINLGFWWMSVDNHYWSCNIIDTIKFNKNFLDKIRIIKRYIINKTYRQRNSIKDIKKEGNRIIHFYQSHYAQYHLYEKGFCKVLPLSDYINMDFITDTKTNKENIVLYNPVKGLNFTKKIIKKLPDINFIPLKNMTRIELIKTMQKAKLYIDFGHFPGKDRLSRECAMNGCCIITGKDGAAGYYEDLPIPNEFKFERKNQNIPTICSKIQTILSQYEKNIPLFNDYCINITQEKEKFYQEIEKAFISPISTQIRAKF